MNNDTLISSRIVETIEALPGSQSVQAVLLAGSWASGEAVHAGDDTGFASDVDLYAVCPKGIGEELRRRLEHNLGLQVTVHCLGRKMAASPGSVAAGVVGVILWGDKSFFPIFPEPRDIPRFEYERLFLNRIGEYFVNLLQYGPTNLAGLRSKMAADLALPLIASNGEFRSTYADRLDFLTYAPVDPSSALVHRAAMIGLEWRLHNGPPISAEALRAAMGQAPNLKVLKGLRTSRRIGDHRSALSAYLRLARGRRVHLGKLIRYLLLHPFEHPRSQNYRILYCLFMENNCSNFPRGLWRVGLHNKELISMLDFQAAATHLFQADVLREGQFP